VSGIGKVWNEIRANVRTFRKRAGLHPVYISQVERVRRFAGARPSPGAAMLNSNGDARSSGTLGYWELAAPGDGRAPAISLPPSLTQDRGVIRAG